MEAMNTPSVPLRDVNGDGDVTAEDLTVLARYVGGLIEGFKELEI